MVAHGLMRLRVSGCGHHTGPCLHGDPFTGAPHPLAEVDLCPRLREVNVEAVEVPYGLLAYKHASERYGQDVLTPVRLALVDLAGVHAGGDASAIGEGDADVEQRDGVVRRLGLLLVGSRAGLLRSALRSVRA